MALASKDQALASKDQALASKDQALASKDQALALRDALTICWHDPQSQGPTSTAKADLTVNNSYSNKLMVNYM